jgi:hypothetical protein
LVNCVYCCSTRSKPVRALLYGLAGLYFIAVAVLAGFSIAAVLSLKSTLFSQVLEPVVEEVFPLTQNNLTFLVQASQLYNFQLPQLDNLQQQFGVVSNTVGNVSVTIHHGIQGFVLGEAVLFGCCVVAALVAFLFRWKGCRGFFAVVGCLLLIALGASMALFVFTGFASNDGLAAVSYYKAQDCPTAETFADDIGQLNLAIADLQNQLQQNPSPTKKVYLELAIATANRSIAVLHAFTDCAAGAALATPALNGLTTQVGPLAFFVSTTILGLIILMVFGFVWAVMFGLVFKPAKHDDQDRSHHPEYQPVYQTVRPQPALKEKDYYSSGSMSDFDKSIN